MEKNRITLKNVFNFLAITIFLVSFSLPQKVTSKAYTVEIVQMQFRPALLKVHKGDTVIFVNRDIVDHDATEVNKAWHSPPLATGQSWKWIANKSADYYCSIHLIMKGQVVVD